MRVQLHQADGQTTGVGIVLVVLRDALASKFRGPRLERQAVLQRGAYIKELKQSRNTHADAGGPGAWGRRSSRSRIRAVDKLPNPREVRFAIRRPRSRSG